PFGKRRSRRAMVAAGLGLAAMGGATGGGGRAGRAAPRGVPPAALAAAAQSTPVAGDRTSPAARIVAIARDAMSASDLRAVILRVTIDGDKVVTAALGESMPGVPATADMRFRNGAVAISYMATMLLLLVDRGVVGLDDPIVAWLPDLPDADRVTLRMLANMTAGYPDYVQNPRLSQDLYVDPFRQWSPQDLIAIGLSTPRVFAPGENWDYSHTNYVILGQALERIAGMPLDDLLQANVLDPLGLRDTVGSATPAIPEPVLHAYTSERRQALGIAPDVRFYEESTFWNPSWTIAQGAIQTTTIDDMATTAVAVGEGTLLSPESYRAMVEPRLLGFGAPLAGCPNCHTLDEQYSYGLGVVRSGDWILQNPLFAGYGAIEAYLPARKLAIAVATTFAEEGFDDQGNYLHSRASWDIFASIGADLAPEAAPPGRAS
ncbi:MAG TPA: serine hydrolase domain-containing protein, partial [Thermomicrobiales bacterium]|nr:serine hydrolase domain-containing protein [Thermomicrobiales bacterium]